MDEHHSVLNQMLLETTGEISKHRRAKSRRRAGSKGAAGADLLGEAAAALSPRAGKGELICAEAGLCWALGCWSVFGECLNNFARWGFECKLGFYLRYPS